LSVLTSQSDLTHSLLAMGTTSLTLPFLSRLSSTSLVATHLTSISAGLGTQLYVSFVAGPTMFLNLPRTTFGNLQARLFPKMGMVTSGSSLLALATYSINHDRDLGSYLLLASFISSLLNTFLIFPVTTKLMFELRKHDEGTEERKQAGKKFGLMHGVSLLANFLAMGANLAYTYILASRITQGW